MLYADSWDRDNGKICTVCKGTGEKIATKPQSKIMADARDGL